MKSTHNLFLWNIAGTVGLLAFWHFLALAMGSDLVLPGPLAVVAKFGEIIVNPRFYSSLGASFFRVVGGFAIAFPLAILCGVAAGLDDRLYAALRPLLAVISTTPVLSIILVALLWFGSDFVPVFTSFLLVFPVLTGNIIEGVKAADTALLEMARVYQFSFKQLFIHIYLPSFIPYLLAGIRTALALSWKVVVAAEVLAQPAIALGTRMQVAKAQLETTELFAWTVLTIFLAGLTEALLSLVLKRRQFYAQN